MNLNVEEGDKENAWIPILSFSHFVKHNFPFFFLFFFFLSEHLKVFHSIDSIKQYSIYFYFYFFEIEQQNNISIHILILFHCIISLLLFLPWNQIPAQLICFCQCLLYCFSKLRYLESTPPPTKKKKRRKQLFRVKDILSKRKVKRYAKNKNNKK